MGWNTRVRFPRGVTQCIIIVGPHTHWMDLVIGLAYRSVLRIPQARFLGKKELFDGPFGFFFRWMGGTPVDRFSKQNTVDQVVDIFRSHPCMMIALSPEGTRKKVDKLRTGFYHIAQKAGVPIVMAGLDFGNKTVLVSEPFYTSNDAVKDFDHILHFFNPIQGRLPEKGMQGLTNQMLSDG